MGRGGRPGVLAFRCDDIPCKDAFYDFEEPATARGTTDRHIYIRVHAAAISDAHCFPNEGGRRRRNLLGGSIF